MNKYLSFVASHSCTLEITRSILKTLDQKALVFTVNFDLQSTVQECEATKASFMFYGWKQKKSPGKASHRDSFRFKKSRV